MNDDTATKPAAKLPRRARLASCGFVTVGAVSVFAAVNGSAGLHPAWAAVAAAAAAAGAAFTATLAARSPTVKAD